jgi:hypothetical protein
MDVSLTVPATADGRNGAVQQVRLAHVVEDVHLLAALRLLGLVVRRREVADDANEHDEQHGAHQ